jgi:hypothetical protein
MSIWMRAKGVELPFPVHSIKDGWTIYKLKEAEHDEFEVLDLACAKLGIKVNNSPEERARFRAILLARDLKCSGGSCATVERCRAAHSCMERRPK